MSDRPGFTLVEVLVALTVLGMTAGAALALQSSGLRSYRAAEATAQAVILARSILEEVEFPQAEEKAQGQVGDGLRWSRVIVREEPDTLHDWLALYRVTVTVTHKGTTAPPVRLVTLRFSPVQRGGRR